MFCSEFLKKAHSTNMVLTARERLHLGVQAARGMEYMESIHLLHMDIAARNCLLAEESLVKIADFGLTRQLAPGSDRCVSSLSLSLLHFCEGVVLIPILTVPFG
jgi:serine/threonine protein kinase